MDPGAEIIYVEYGGKIMSKICTSCGASMNDNQVFCPNCGAQVTGGGAPAPQPQQQYTQPQQQFAQQPQPQYQQPQMQQNYDQPQAYGQQQGNYYDQPQQPQQYGQPQQFGQPAPAFAGGYAAPAPKKKTGLIIGIIAAVVVVAAVVVFILLRKNGTLDGNYKKPIDDFYSGISSGDYKKTLDAMYIGDESYTEEDYEDYDYGATGMTISWKEKSKTKLTKDEINKINDDYEVKKNKVTAGYRVDITLTYTYQGESETEDDTITVVKCSKGWKILPE